MDLVFCVRKKYIDPFLSKQYGLQNVWFLLSKSDKGTSDNHSTSVGILAGYLLSAKQTHSVCDVLGLGIYAIVSLVRQKSVPLVKSSRLLH